MATYANVEIEGGEFSVKSDGRDKETIRLCVRAYVNEAKGKVKPDYLAKVVVDAITAEACRDYYAPFGLGFVYRADYHWKVTIGKRGGVKIKNERR